MYILCIHDIPNLKIFFSISRLHDLLVFFSVTIIQEISNIFMEKIHV